MLALLYSTVCDFMSFFDMTDLYITPNPLPLHSNNEPNPFPACGLTDPSRAIFILQLMHHTGGFVASILVFLVFLIVVACVPLEATMGLPWKAWLIPGLSGLGTWWFGKHARVRWALLNRWRRVRRERRERDRRVADGKAVLEKEKTMVTKEKKRVEVDAKDGNGLGGKEEEGDARARQA